MKISIIFSTLLSISILSSTASGSQVGNYHWFTRPDISTAEKLVELDHQSNNEFFPKQIIRQATKKMKRGDFSRERRFMMTNSLYPYGPKLLGWMMKEIKEELKPFVKTLIRSRSARSMRQNYIADTLIFAAIVEAEMKADSSFDLLHATLKVAAVFAGHDNYEGVEVIREFDDGDGTLNRALKGGKIIIDDVEGLRDDHGRFIHLTQIFSDCQTMKREGLISDKKSCGDVFKELIPIKSSAGDNSTYWTFFHDLALPFSGFGHADPFYAGPFFIRALNRRLDRPVAEVDRGL